MVQRILMGLLEDSADLSYSDLKLLEIVSRKVKSISAMLHD